MIKLKVKIKAEATTYTHTEFLPEEYNVSKENPLLQRLVESVCKNSHLEDIQDVIITATFEW
jgi:hypothetical protein